MKQTCSLTVRLSLFKSCLHLQSPFMALICWALVLGLQCTFSVPGLICRYWNFNLFINIPLSLVQKVLLPFYLFRAQETLISIIHALCFASWKPLILAVQQFFVVSLCLVMWNEVLLKLWTRDIETYNIFLEETFTAKDDWRAQVFVNSWTKEVTQNKAWVSTWNYGFPNDTIQFSNI